MACRGARAGVARRVPRGSRPRCRTRGIRAGDVTGCHRAAGDRDPGDRGGDARLRWVWHLGAHCTEVMVAQLGFGSALRARRRFGRCCRGWTPPIWTGGWVPTQHGARRAGPPRSVGSGRPRRQALRGALRAGATATDLVSVFAHRARLVLGQFAVAEKSNEIPCVRKLLKLLPRRVRWLVTVDAMHTQVATANLICTTVKSHYLMVVKANQAGLLARITALPWANGRVAATDTYPADPHHHKGYRLSLRQTGRPDHPRTRRHGHRQTRRRGRLRHLQPAVRASPASEIATWLRQHGGIENSLHWVRDVTYDEDRSTTHIGNGAQIMASLRNTAINGRGATYTAEACRATALTVNRRLDLLSPRNPSSAHKPANQLRRNPGVQRLPRRHDHIVR